MDTAPTSLSSRAARAHALKNCLSVVIAINKLLEQEMDDRSQCRGARRILVRVHARHADTEVGCNFHGVLERADGTIAEVDAHDNPSVAAHR